jgi:hypothetical protein
LFFHPDHVEVFLSDVSKLRYFEVFLSDVSEPPLLYTYTSRLCDTSFISATAIARRFVVFPVEKAQPRVMTRPAP